MIKRLKLCLLLSLLVGCMPAKVPMPFGHNTDDRGEQSYRTEISFALGRQTASDDQVNEAFMQLTTGGNPKEIKEAMAKALRRHIKEQEQLCTLLNQIHPPAKYKKFHNIYTTYRRKVCDISIKMLKIIDDNKFAELYGLVQEADQIEAKFKEDLKEVLRESGAISLQEYLGL